MTNFFIFCNELNLTRAFLFSDAHIPLTNTHSSLTRIHPALACRSRSASQPVPTRTTDTGSRFYTLLGCYREPKAALSAA